jgi:hypothetical protein
MVLLTIQDRKLITVRSEQWWDTYKFISLQKKCITGEMLVIVKAEDRTRNVIYEMHFPAHLTSIIYQETVACKPVN